MSPKNKLLLFFVLFYLTSCNTYKLPKVVNRTGQIKSKNEFVLSDFDSTTIRDKKYFIEISRYKKGKKNGRCFQFIVCNKLDTCKVSAELFRTGKYKNDQKRGFWKDYENGKKTHWEYWGRNKSYNTTIKNKKW